MSGSFGGNKYAHLTDKELVQIAQAGEREAVEYLLYKYKNLVGSIVKDYFVPDAEKEDLLQIGMIGLWQAIMKFHEQRVKSFSRFAETCIRRVIINAIRSAHRHKRMVLTGSESIEGTGGQVDLLMDEEVSPEEVVLRREVRRLFEKKLKDILSEFEWRVFEVYKEGKSYSEAAVELNCGTKSIDCALTRIKRKIAKLVLGGEL